MEVKGEGVLMRPFIAAYILYPGRFMFCLRTHWNLQRTTRACRAYWRGHAEESDEDRAAPTACSTPDGPPLRA
ncbi:unnamed protein product [Vitrella brassicaformis CCMP3155]|uniref:Uncharacterized protein n=1 Tax=Vitrella brassicaformis (strain CCMP3155) TaxID=1169540 RepID=A0A0G4FT29_VITBC|nr:unnamed protein product [Vitrella brassicaformis CCMP3155]|eukprot:CEM17776.1 unnamed protein product [Vitrella brassicaformis CCMP3155]